jgi:hypothetical protein
MRFSEPVIKLYGKNGRPAELGAIIRFNTAKGG